MKRVLSLQSRGNWKNGWRYQNHPVPIIRVLDQILYLIDPWRTWRIMFLIESEKTGTQGYRNRVANGSMYI